MRNVMEAVSGIRVCWMMNKNGNRISILVICPEKKAKTYGDRKLAARAQKMAEQEARRLGTVIETGVFMGGDGNGCVTATGIADLLWSSETEQKVCMSGIPQLQ
jgi:hypothetical protein